MPRFFHKYLISHESDRQAVLLGSVIAVHDRGAELGEAVNVFLNFDRNLMLRAGACTHTCRPEEHEKIDGSSYVRGHKDVDLWYLDAHLSHLTSLD